jgi:hypothetical protein
MANVGGGVQGVEVEEIRNPKKVLLFCHSELAEEST